jgi:hypothetical protein
MFFVLCCKDAAVFESRKCFSDEMMKKEDESSKIWG